MIAQSGKLVAWNAKPYNRFLNYLTKLLRHRRSHYCKKYEADIKYSLMSRTGVIRGKKISVLVFLWTVQLTPMFRHIFRLFYRKQSLYLSAIEPVKIKGKYINEQLISYLEKSHDFQ